LALAVATLDRLGLVVLVLVVGVGLAEIFELVAKAVLYPVEEAA